jgi:hypothetical protein
LGWSIRTGVGSARLVNVKAGLLGVAGGIDFDVSSLPHDSRQSLGLVGWFVALATGGSIGVAGAAIGAGLAPTSVQVVHVLQVVQGVFGLNSRLMNVCRKGEGVQLTHEDWLHGAHGWQQVLQQEEQLQLDFWETAAPPVIGTRRGCGEALDVVSRPSVLGTAGYWTTCVPIGVRETGLLGTTGFGWLTTGVDAGLPFLIAGRVAAGSDHLEAGV